MPHIIKMFNLDYSLRQIANSEAVKPSGCAISRISEIRTLWKQGKIDSAKVGTLNEIRINNKNNLFSGNSQDDYTGDFLMVLTYLARIKRKNNYNRPVLSDYKIAYRNLCKIIHPDFNNNNSNANREMIGLNRAYEIIKDDPIYD